MKISVKNVVLVGLYTGIVFGVARYTFSKVEPATADIGGGSRPAEEVEEKKSGGTQNLGKTRGILAHLFSGREAKPEKEIEEYLNSERVDYESWQFRRAIKKVALEDWTTAQMYLDKIPNQSLKNKVVLKLIQGVGEEDPDLAVKITELAPTETLRQRWLGDACEKIAVNNPKFVAELFKSNGMKNIGEYKVHNLAADYSRHNFEEARTFIDSIEDPVIWESAFTQHMYVWGKKDPHAAADYAISQKTTAAFSGPLWIIGQHLASEDPATALTYAMSKPANQNSKELITGVYIGWAENDVHAAADKVLTLPINRIRIQGYEILAGEFAKVDPAKGKEWLSKIGNHLYRRNSTNQFMKQWVAVDPSAAAEYANSLDTGEIKDYAIYPMMEKFQDVEPAYAIEWARALNNQRGKDNWTKLVYEKWRKQNAQAAEAWLQQTDLIPEDTKQLLNQ